MTREQAIHSLIAHGFKVEQFGEIIKAVTPQEPRKGHWIDNKCTNCGYEVQPWNNTNYCPNCGSRNEVEE